MGVLIAVECRVVWKQFLNHKRNSNIAFHNLNFIHTEYMIARVMQKREGGREKKISTIFTHLRLKVRVHMDLFASNQWKKDRINLVIKCKLKEVVSRSGNGFKDNF